MIYTIKSLSRYGRASTIDTDMWYYEDEATATKQIMQRLDGIQKAWEERGETVSKRKADNGYVVECENGFAKMWVETMFKVCGAVLAEVQAYTPKDDWDLGSGKEENAVLLHNRTEEDNLRSELYEKAKSLLVQKYGQYIGNTVQFEFERGETAPEVGIDVHIYFYKPKECVERVSYGTYDDGRFPEELVAGVYDTILGVINPQNTFVKDNGEVIEWGYEREFVSIKVYPNVGGYLKADDFKE
jgi:hypothetical protein